MVENLKNIYIIKSGEGGQLQDAGQGRVKLPDPCKLSGDVFHIDFCPFAIFCDIVFIEDYEHTHHAYNQSYSHIPVKLNQHQNYVPVPRQ